MNLRLLSLLVLLFHNLYSTELTITNPNDSFDDFTVKMYEDKSASQSFEEVRKSGVFKEHSNNISTGYSNSSFWFYFTIENRSTLDLHYVIKSTETFLHHVDCYIISADGSWTLLQQGVGYTNREGVVENSELQFPIDLQEGEKKSIYIRMFSLYPNYTSLQVMSEKAEREYTMKHNTLMALYFGAAIALMLYNFFIFLFSKRKTYLIYVIYVFFFASWQLSLNGFPPFDTHSSTQAYYYFGGSAIPLWIAFVHFFTRSILDTKKNFPRIDKVINLIGVFYLFLTVLSWFELHLAFIIINGLASLALPFLLFVGFKSYLSGNKTALFYIVAQISFLSLSTLFSLMTDGYLEYSLLTRHGIVVGSFIEILLFSFALGYRLRTLENEKLSLIEHAHAILELKVKERTKELHKLNKELERITITDKLTKVLNRHGLDQALDIELERYHRYGNLFGVILLDIDHFKLVNDEFGHQSGDYVLEEIASILQNSTRENDIVGRWGGEEFLIFCLESDLQTTKEVAEKLRREIDSHDFLQVGSQSASFGLTVIHESDTVDTLIKRVDRALYMAKERGRNCVVLEK